MRGAFKKAERELCIPTHEPDTDNAGVGILKLQFWRLSLSDNLFFYTILCIWLCIQSIFN